MKVVDVVGDATRAGYVEYAPDYVVSSADGARKAMIVTLCGLIEGADEWGEMPGWPLQPQRSTDEKNLAVMADYLGLDEREYDEITTEALQLTCTPEYYTLHVAVTGMLGYVPRIGPQMIARLERLTREVREQWN